MNDDNYYQNGEESNTSESDKQKRRRLRGWKPQIPETQEHGRLVVTNR